MRILWGVYKVEDWRREGQPERERESLGREQVKFLFTAIRDNCGPYQVYTYIQSRELYIHPRSIFSVL
jgi:hypothetical protein